MKIHSSSLNIAPIGFNQKTGNNDSAQHIDKDDQNKKVNPPSTTEAIKKTLESTSLSTDATIIKPTDSRTTRALFAYHQQFNALVQDQRAQLITGIDTYA